MAEHPRILVAGGGAAGFFAAIACAEANPGAEVLLHEATAHLLAKVRVSGGGRCNVTHACLDAREMAKSYPRGARELIGPLSRFGPADTVAWFKDRGVEMKTEKDGRMFPVTDSSATIVDCLTGAARKAGVSVSTGSGLRRLAKVPGDGSGRFTAELSGGAQVLADRVLIATGGGRGSAGQAMAQALGHTITPTVPSLFTFHVDDPRLAGLEGLAVPTAGAAAKGTRLREAGPVLVTHWGLSGPAILRLSAWGARELHDAGYVFTLAVNWAEPRSTEAARDALDGDRSAHPRRRVSTGNPLGIPARLWERLVVAAGIAPDATWSGVSNDRLRALALQSTASEFAVSGKSMNKEEFVTCGGVNLAEVDMATMESRICPGLHFAGEVLDIDGITGGFNFQAAWTTGWQAGRAMALGPGTA
jgi:predicted Rossmann fold flavoprotein